MSFRKSDKDLICKNVNRPVGSKSGYYGILSAMRRKAKQSISETNSWQAKQNT
jgi:hypothetical protein